MPSTMPTGKHIQVDITWSQGQLSNWSFTTRLIGDDLERTRVHQIGNITRISISSRGGYTDVWIERSGVRPLEPDVHSYGFARAMRALAKETGLQVHVITSSYRAASERALNVRGVYGDPPPPPVPPVPATVHDVAMLKQAHAEYHARIRGENTRTKLGFCQVPGECANVAASIELIGERYQAVCKAHTPIDTAEIAAAVDLVRRNRKVYVKEVHNFGIRRDAYVRAVSSGLLTLIKEGPYTRWELAPVPSESIAADVEQSAPFTIRSKRKSTSANRRYRRGA